MDSRFRDIETFLAAARQIKKLPELSGLLRDFVPSLGLDYFAIADVSGPRAHANLFQMNTYPEAWTATILARAYRERDPVLAACGTTALGFVWSEISQLIELTHTQKEIFVAASRAGMGEGFTVPIHIPGEPLGVANFCVAAGKKFPHSSIPFIQYAGCFVLEHARRISRQNWVDEVDDVRTAQVGLSCGDRSINAPKKLPSNAEAAALGLRDSDVAILQLAAEGMVDKMIAHQLGCDPSWVHQRWRSVRSLLGAADRSHAVGIAMTLGFIRPPARAVHLLKAGRKTGRLN